LIVTAGRRLRFIRDERAGATIEFVALMPAFLLLTFFIFEVGVPILWVGTAEKAVQLGARLAIVSNYAVTGLTPTSTNSLAGGSFIYVQRCSAGACTPFATQTCIAGTSAQCDSTNFTTIVNRMASLSNLIQSQYVTITYTYIGLGYAGGPLVPGVTVTLAGVPYGAVVTTILGSFMKLATGDQSASSPFYTLPTKTVTLTGEDLNTAGAP